MSQSVPPPQSGNPFAGGPGPGADPAAQQQPFAAYPVQPPAPARNNLALGLLAAFVAALVAAGAYGGIAGAIDREVGYAAVGVGLLVGFLAGKVGGRNPVLPVVSAVIAAGAVYLGQLVTIAVLLDKLGEGSFAEIFFQNFGGVMELWKLAADGMTYVFIAIGAVAAFAGARKGAA
ncbi:hypothetical protein [Streptomyces thermolilacinus]|uniref:Uncharacterized protein n=1 Tax=Streptomyces thermolilacinus SPC6 TaxID=1306406 RepID=A0A1D3DR41_9ACTN|nr:hypothetical protein [Streptomyces thermolilacinus]OEJ94780.1 hypothetical protein J116_010130 [Streptomyces thermolilacinus SPC6]